MLTMWDVFASGPGDWHPTYRTMNMCVPREGGDHKEAQCVLNTACVC